MARRINKATRKTAPAHKRAAQAPKRKKPATATKKTRPAAKAAAKKAVSKKKTSKRTVPAKKTKKVKPAPKAAPPARKRTKKTAPKPRPAARASKAKPRGETSSSKPVTRKAALVRRPLPPPKPSSHQLAELRIAKERRQAMGRQADFYEKASRAFNARRFQSALTLFEKAAAGPDLTFSNRARVYVAICRRQTKPRKVKLKTADEFYNYGIQLVNAHQFDEAGRSLTRALKLQPRGAHIHFAVAVLGALTQDATAACKSLKRAIELDPRNRVLALNDADLATVVKEPAIARLLHGPSEPSTSR